MTRYPYVRKYSETRYTFIDLMREILTEYIRYQEPEAWKNYHRLAMQKLQSESVPNLDWHYYDLSYNEQQAMRAWQQAVEEAYRNANREHLSQLLEAATDKTLKLTELSCARRAYEQGRYYAFCQQQEDALESYRQALAIFQSLHDTIGEAKALLAIDWIQQGKQGDGRMLN